MADNAQYWINQDGVQQGPLTLEQLLSTPVGNNTYVWSPGYDDWKPMAEVPELAHLVQPTAEVQAPRVAIPEIPTDDVPVGQPLEQAAGVTDSVTPQSDAPTPAGGQYPPCPPTNLVWAILATILCCIPLGIVAIVYANKVSKKYYEGDVAAAEHYSEVSAWWCIGAIVGGIILSPFVSLIQMAIMP